MRLLVTGRHGQVATALRERCDDEHIELITLGRPDFDLADASSGVAAIVEAKPDAIVSAAAYTAVDRAESDRDTAEAVNATGPGVVAKAAAELGVPIIHLSTDYVFDGAKDEPYLETDPTNPLGVYGATKLRGEQAVIDATPNHAILRTAWVYSPFGVNFLKTMLRAGAERPDMRVVDDQHGNPTSAHDIADAIIIVAHNLINHPENDELRGIFHLAGSGEGTWADFASEIFAVSAAVGGASPHVTRITAAEYPTAARRPANSRLATTKVGVTHGIVMPDWRASTRNTVTRLLTA